MPFPEQTKPEYEPPTPGDFNPIEPPDMGTRKGLPIEEADIVVRVSRFRKISYGPPPWPEESDGIKRISLESHFLDYGSTMELLGPNGDYWVLNFIEIIEREVEDELDG